MVRGVGRGGREWGPISECITALCWGTNALMFEISFRIRGAREAGRKMVNEQNREKSTFMHYSTSKT